jgi:hypothetical protein
MPKAYIIEVRNRTAGASTGAVKAVWHQVRAESDARQTLYCEARTYRKEKAVIKSEWRIADQMKVQL